MFTMCNAPSTHMLRHRDATELNNDGMIKLGATSIPNRTEFINISERHLMLDDSSFCSHIHLAIIDLRCHVFPFKMLFLNARLCL